MNGRWGRMADVSCTVLMPILLLILSYRFYLYEENSIVYACSIVL